MVYPIGPKSCGIWVFYLGGIIKQITYFIDGFNVYHSLAEASIKNPTFKKYKWLNYAKLAKCFKPPRTNFSDTIIKIYYFTALTFWNKEKLTRHKLYIQALEHVGIKVVYGQFRSVDKFCTKCNQFYSTYEEKRTDVNIAIKLFEEARNDNFDTAIIISGDSDLIPSIQVTKSLFPDKEFGVIIPFNRSAEELKNVAHFYMKMRPDHLDKSLFEEKIVLNNGIVLTRPPNWK